MTNPLADAAMIAPDSIDQAPLLSTAFTVEDGHGRLTSAELTVTALGVVEPALDGEPVSADVLTPGWSSYEQRLRYVTYDVTERLPHGDHRLTLALGNGWARGRLGWGGGRAFYTDELGAIAALRLTFADGHEQLVTTGPSWVAHRSDVLEDDLYDGQTIDARRRGDSSGPSEDDGVHVLEFDKDRLVAHPGPPVRRQQSVRPVSITRSPQGRTLVGFGQNLVGWVRFTVQGERGTAVRIRHAEELEDGELSMRPLRSAQATDTFILSGGIDTFEPTFTFHGFRYVDVDGWPGELRADDLEAVVVHSQMRRIGEFACSEELVNQLHRNVVWSQKGNFLDVPTDCPQRDERMGWTGDLAVFAPTAAYLYDVSDLLQEWLRDLAVEIGLNPGTAPLTVPDIVKYWDNDDVISAPAVAVWSDAAAWVPWALWEAYGDREALAETYPLTAGHVRRVADLLSPTGLWDTGRQYGDWLDPDAPKEKASAAKADPGVGATAAFYRSARIAADMASVLGHHGDHSEFAALSERVRTAFLDHYVDDAGIITSDCATVYALAIEFGLLDERRLPRAGERLAQLVTESGFRVSTGFAGTPFVTGALSSTGHVEVAYRLLLEQSCPSWLYPVTMGATSIWERWDSRRPDGSINPDGMTSFNHYALGAVASWLHRTVAGIAPLDPGYSRFLVAPRPGGGLSWARGALEVTTGRIEVGWRAEDTGHALTVEVPPGTRAVLDLPGRDAEEVGPGRHLRTF